MNERTFPKVPGINGNPLIPSIGASPNRVTSGSKLPTFRKSAPKRVKPTGGYIGADAHVKASKRSRIVSTSKPIRATRTRSTLPR
jgi:hypothetical protein